MKTLALHRHQWDSAIGSMPDVTVQIFFIVTAPTVIEADELKFKASSSMQPHWL